MPFCSNCGTQLPEGAKFCTECGQKLDTAPQPPREELIARAKDMIAFNERHLKDGGEERLAIGSRVRHDVFGEGAIENIDVDRGAYMVRFDGMATPRMISFRAKLTSL